MSTVFDLVKEPKTKNEDKELEYFEWAVSDKPVSIKKPVEFKDYPELVVKGGIKGLARLGTSFADLAGMGLEAAGIKKYIPDVIMDNIPSSKQVDTALEEWSPSQDHWLEGIAERGAPWLAGGPEKLAANALRGALSGTAGQAVEALGGGPLLQTGAELVAGNIKSAVSKRLSPSARELSLSSGKTIPQNKLVEEASRLGLTDTQITPLIQSENKQKLISQLASKGKATQQALLNTNKGINNIYESLLARPEASKSMTSSALEIFEQELARAAKTTRTENLSALKAPLDRFFASSRTGEDLILLHKDITKAGKEVSHFKDPIKKALSSIDKDLGMDYALANDFKSRYYDIAAKLKPGKFEEFITSPMGKVIGTGVATLITQQDPSLIIKTLGGLAAGNAVRKLFSKMLTNPRYQNMSKKFIESLNQNKPQAAQIIARNYIKELHNDKIDPQVVLKLQLGLEDELFQPPQEYIE